MNIFQFCNGCFRNPCDEMTIDLAVSAKTEYEQIFDFAAAAVQRLCDNPAAAAPILQESDEKARQELLTLMGYLKQNVEITLEPIRRIYAVGEAEWNDIAYAFETEYSYFYVEWYTTA